MSPESTNGRVSGNPNDAEYIHMVDLAESILEEIAGRTPNWCQIARDAQELSGLAGALCGPQ
jgi:hypothetical protein